MCVASYRLYAFLVIIGGGGNYCHIIKMYKLRRTQAFAYYVNMPTGVSYK